MLFIEVAILFLLCLLLGGLVHLSRLVQRQRADQAEQKQSLPQLLRAESSHLFAQWEAYASLKDRLDLD